MIPGADDPSPRRIIHIDMDAFFASVEQRDNPALRGRPVAVGGSSQRGVVAAASYEARVFGVRSAMPSVTAARLCPDLIFVKSRFEVYRAVSQQIREIFADYTPLVEPLSLDEAYLDVTDHLPDGMTATAIAKQIRARIRQVTGLTASAGVSYNKFLAKLASDQNKPDGLCVITPDRGPEFVLKLPVGKFHGIGPATAAKMQAMGLHTGADLRAQSLEFLTRRFGKAGRYYWNISRGVDFRRVSPDRIRKSVGAENTFAADLMTLDQADQALEPLAAKVWTAVARHELQGRTVTIKAKFSDFQQVTRARSLGHPVASETELLTIARDLVRIVLPDPRGARLLGITLSGFDVPDDGPEQLDLFA
ncbi:DNA polymerase IV [Paracoccus sp. 1_MG-2023]|uniref:DNA polymerase IV n=1 Tax=unclassified Paracoccus (in: a-proteobacteria) TaxID=2688777 RepID=UPI001C08D731|nr:MULTISPECIES: DNA polymerase IV [unclassified Paracoccus (in: a-proteobacteria)]MBU2957065.1 DNA polymerase IV [Paracoccus sp. C2R09]MDO6668263.1 DNA polymerase IV [Paracoccus sp. 1_MG-2023]